VETKSLDSGSIKIKAQNTIDEIKQAYLSGARPWIVGYSGGKDSTATLQLVWKALDGLKPEDRDKQIYVISSDTLVETPIIKEYLYANHEKIKKAAEDQNLPISTNILTPITDETFWVNLIGRGYPAPQQMFRWCTSRLKIKTSSRFIRNRISKYGEVVIVLGIREKESSSRKKVMTKLDIEGNVFSRSNQFSAAFTYAPIRDWTTWEVWQYLMLNNNPWGNDNRKLAQMYKDATGDCPFVMEENSPPCGNSRFGCWVCTLVQEDKSVESLINSGEKWLQPLLDFRNYLKKTQESKMKEIVRDYKLRRGVVLFKKNYEGEIIRGPYRFWFRKALLKFLLYTQKLIQENGPKNNLKLIKRKELDRIRQIWRTEEGDWEDSLPQIYKDVFGINYWNKDDNNPFNRYDKKILAELSSKHGVPEKLVRKLIDLELQTQGMSIRHSIFKRMDKIFNEEWRSKEEIIEEYENKKENLYDY